MRCPPVSSARWLVVVFSFCFLFSSDLAVREPGRVFPDPDLARNGEACVVLPVRLTGPGVKSDQSRVSRSPQRAAGGRRRLFGRGEAARQGTSVR